MALGTSPSDSFIKPNGNAAAGGGVLAPSAASNWSDIISDFMDYTEGAISPSIHRLWSGIALVAGACERRVWIEEGDYINFPSLYILLVAPPGTGKSIINSVKELWRATKFPNTADSDAFHVAPDSVTRASLVDEIADSTASRVIKLQNYTYSALLVAAEEFEVLLPFYDIPFISLLNSLWNTPVEHTEKRRHGPAKSVIIERPVLHILGGAQPSYFVAHFPEEAWTTGFARRVIMVYADSAPERRPFYKTPNRTVLKDKILRKLANISEMYGGFTVTKGARVCMEDWHEKKLAPVPNHPRLAYYVTTRWQYMLKLSLVSSISRSPDPFIEEFDVQRALEWLFDAEKVMPDIFRAMAGKSDGMVLEELHRALLSKWIKDKSPIKTQFIIQYLSNRVTSERIGHVLQIAQGAGLMVRAQGVVDAWIPRPSYSNGELY